MGVFLAHFSGFVAVGMGGFPFGVTVSVAATYDCGVMVRICRILWSLYALGICLEEI